MTRLLWIGMPPWRRDPSTGRRAAERALPNLVTMYRTCRNEGRGVLYSVRAALRLAWLPLAPWPVTVLDRLTLYGWGWDLHAFRTHLVWAPKEAGLYVSPDGTPTRATRWIWRTVPCVRP